MNHMTDKYKCVICGKEWDLYDYKMGTKLVEPGEPMISSGIHVCHDCKHIVYEFHERVNDNQRELRHIMQEWYKMKKYR